MGKVEHSGEVSGLEAGGGQEATEDADGGGQRYEPHCAELMAWPPPFLGSAHRTVLLPLPWPWVGPLPLPGPEKEKLLLLLKCWPQWG